VPLYQLYIPPDGPSADRKAELARAITDVHAAVTGAPSQYVYVSFHQLEPASLFAAGEPVSRSSLVGIIRSGRSPDTKRRLIEGLAQAWSGVTGEALTDLAVFIQEVPGSSMMENGQLLPEAYED
jgi:phenylpyruvate tautomerase PptA (4-oxalocrotonate tautomerase family)